MVGCFRTCVFLYDVCFHHRITHRWTSCILSLSLLVDSLCFGNNEADLYLFFDSSHSRVTSTIRFDGQNGYPCGQINIPWILRQRGIGSMICMPLMNVWEHLTLKTGKPSALISALHSRPALYPLKISTDSKWADFTPIDYMCNGKFNR